MSVNVNIKMYKVGELGDCFLLRFTDGAAISHVLIDCGSFRNGKKSVDRMKLIAADIETRLEGHSLNVVVGTHQHNDHLSGFVHAEDVFRRIQPEQVWLSWLDDPKDAQAKVIGKDYNNYLTNLRHISRNLDTRSVKGKDVKAKLDAVLGFWGINPEQRANAKTDNFPAELPAVATELLRTLGKKKPEYLTPGSVLRLPGLPSGHVNVYVLGPPKNEKMLFDKDPAKNETYDPHLALNSFHSAKMLSALRKLNGKEGPREDSEPYPFDEPYRDSDNFKYVEAEYNNPRNKWRQIDTDWLAQAEQLALWLDGFTNNSSLVLAFELVESGKVLLFAADAQTGNWLSWKDVKFKGKPKDFNWLSLVKNTVLYKTGHHGSHNSTLPEAFDNMTHEELVVLIPVDVSDPNIKKENGWKMPAKNLYEEIKKRSKNRVIRMDKGISRSTNWNKLPYKPKGTKKSLYWEYEVKG